MMKEILWQPVESIKPYDRNPRNNEAAVDAVAASIKAFGWRQPIVVDKEGVIIVGHTRYKAALKLGCESVPVTVADDLNEEQVRAYRLADNKTNEKAVWNFDLLNDELNELLDFDMSQFGFLQSEDIKLDVNDEDFLQDTEITKEKKPREVVCPACGKVIKL